MSKKFDCGKSLELVAKKVMQNYEDLMCSSLKAAGFSVKSGLMNLDKESGAMIGGCMEFYKDAKKLIVTQAKAMDKILKNFDELKEINQKLCEQNDELQKTLQELSHKIESKDLGA